MQSGLLAVRLLIAGACIAATSVYLSAARRAEQPPPRTSLVEFPGRLDEWSAIPTESFDPAVVKALGVDEYVNRYYASGRRLAHLYIGYYASQREGDTIHSPMNCLPGAGWQPVSSGTLEMQMRSGPIRVNRFLIQKGLDKQVVLYWYQSHGRTVASDYWSKIYLVLDSIRYNRTDAALVRVIAPLDDGDPDPENAAEHTATAFVRQIYPLLGRYLPS